MASDWWKRRREYLEHRGWIPASELKAGRPPVPPKPPKRAPAAPVPVRELTNQEVFTRNIAMFAAIVVFAILANVMVLSSIQQQANQQKLRNQLQSELAAATAPTSEGDVNNVLLSNGAPVALIRIPEIGVNQVVVEGTDGATLKLGPGHRRDTVLPGQEGTSIVMARAWAYGGPFGAIASLSPGSKIEVITGQGFLNYEVIGVRYAGDPAPAEPAAGASRLVLETAHGSAFTPTGIVRVDAQMISTSETDPALGPSQPTQPTQPTPSSTASPSPSATAAPAAVGTPTPIPATPSATPSPSPTGASAAATTNTQAFAAGARFTYPQSLPLAQREMATDTSGLLVLILALQLLVAVEVAAIWAYRRFGFERTWIVATPVVVLAAIVVADQITLLLPNLL